METQSSLPNRGRSPLPIFGPFLLCPNGWMHQDATRYGGKCGALPVVAGFVALEQQIILVKTRSESV